MGCTHSKSSGTAPASVFKVVNLDCNGNVKHDGHIEITSSELVLRLKDSRAPTIAWPLNSVRKYGYENFLFCFEAGRSSPVGEGIFAFKSKKAKQMFDLLKEELIKSANSVPHSAEDISLDIREYSGQTSSSTNMFERVNEEVIQFSTLKYCESNEYVRTPDLMESDTVSFSPQPTFTSRPQDKKLINAGIFSSNEYELPSEVLTYTEVEISVYPVRQSEPSPPPTVTAAVEPSDYNVIDFVQTMNVSKKMFKSSGVPGVKKTRHDFPLENDLRNRTL